MVVPAYSPSTQKSEAGGSQCQGLPVTRQEPLSLILSLSLSYPKDVLLSSFSVFSFATYHCYC
jgi:hypothetical protein